MKISIIGAGNVGSALAERILAHNLADVVLVDVIEGMAEGKALDLLDASPIMGYETRVCGTTDYGKTKNSDIVVITAGLARKPGMSREDLISKNSSIVSGVLDSVNKFSAESIIVMVTNPLDVMTYVAYKKKKSDRKKVLGMAGTLDTARFKLLLSQELGADPGKIETFVLGSHGDTMVPLVSKTLVDGKPVTELIKKERLKSIIGRTKERGGEIVGLLKSGSAYFSPSAGCFELLKAIAGDEKKIMPCSCVLSGEYGINDCPIGVPARIGRDGVLEIVKWELDSDELDALRQSAEAVKQVLNKTLKSGV